jgi:hypothetical protein
VADVDEVEGVDRGGEFGGALGRSDAMSRQGVPQAAFGEPVPSG